MRTSKHFLLAGPAAAVLVLVATAPTNAMQAPAAPELAIGEHARSTSQPAHQDQTISPLRHLKGCAASTTTQHRKKQLRAAIRVARIARERTNYSGFYLAGRSCRAGKLVLTGVGKPSNKVRIAIRAAQRDTGLKTTWKRVPHTRAELKKEGRRLWRNPVVAFTEVDAAGRVLTIGTEDDALRAAPKVEQRKALNITVRHFRVRGADVPAAG